MIRTAFSFLLLTSFFASASAEEKVSFARDVRPILNAKCTSCHGGVKQAGGVSFVYKDQVIDFAGDSGNPVVKPGDAEVSELFFRITLPADDSDRMPPADEHPEGLNEREIDLIKRWINQGGEWAGHWSFEKPTRPDIPKVSESHPAKNDIDAFVLARLEEENLAPSTPATAGRFLRRLSLDLTGLPPSLEEVEAFESAYSDNPDAAVAKAVDDLLGRAAFGERWATMWLDLVRYADSRGLGQDGKRTIWPYRDWVIGAFNEDMPFDQFTIRQLAGDLLPNPTINDLIATAAHRNTQTNNEGGTDDEEFRTEAVIDRVNTTWQTWGSMTFGCVQCHDHPYEAFQHDEYYEFLAFFNNTADSDLNNDEPLLRVPNNRADYSKARELDQSIETLQNEIWKAGRAASSQAKWNPFVLTHATSSNNTKLAFKTVDGQSQFHTVGTVQRGPIYQLHAEYPAGAPPVTGIRVTILPKNPNKALKDSEWGFEISDFTAAVAEISEDGNADKEVPIAFAASIPDIPRMPNEPHAIIEPSGKGFEAWTRLHHQREIVILPTEPIDVAGKRLKIRINNKGFLLGSFPLVIQKGFLETSSDPSLTTFANDPGQAKKRADLKAQIASRKAIPATTIPVMAERPPSIARPTHVFARGNFLEKDKPVEIGVPESLPALTTENPTRLDMAKWWVSPEHPLTSRVFVNRVWEQLFGIGLVATLEDFGSSGEKPSHPALLDYLAVRFRDEHGWSVKEIVRDIVTSATYRQQAHASEEMTERDPANRLLARGPRGRLSAETLRDQALAISGLLTDKVGGVPVHPPIPAGVWKPFQSGDKWETPGTGEPDRYRRSLYTYTKRSIPFPTFATFDAPSREFCNPRRLVSNTPLQALTMLNDEAFAEAAAGLARRMKYDTEGTVSEKISTGYRIATARDPDQGRLDELVGLFDKLEAEYKSKPELHKGMAGSPDGAAFTIVAQVILNLDEVLTK